MLKRSPAWRKGLCCVIVFFAVFCTRLLFVRAGETGTVGYAADEILVMYRPEGGDLISTLSDGRAGILSQGEEGTIALVRLEEEMTVEDAVESFEEQENVLAACPNYIFELYGVSEEINDPGLSMQGYLSQIHAQEAWESLKEVDHEKARVFVLDTGADKSHSDLEHVINWELSKEVLDSQGTLGVLQGDDYINGICTENGEGHGTHVCGVIAAEAGNMTGIAGVGSAADNSFLELVAVDIFSDTRTTKLSYLIAGMEYAAAQDADVVNLSLGIDKEGIFDDTILKAECDKLYESNITLVCAAGNDGEYDDGIISVLPCDYETAIGVAAVDGEGKKASFSNYGIYKDIAAPGNNIYSTKKGNTYGYKSGTSSAAPMVSAAAGLLYAVEPDLTPDEVKFYLQENAAAASDERISNLGILDCGKAIRALIRESCNPYDDIVSTNWFYDSAISAYDAGVMTGLRERIFGPCETLSRAQFAAILYRMSQEPSVEYGRMFADVEDGKWYSNAIEWNAQNGIVAGYDSGLFGPADAITREQMAVILYRYAVYEGKEVSEHIALDRFADAEEVSGFAETAMEWAAAKQLIRGKDGGSRLDPQGQANRAECAAIIMRYMGLL